MTIDITPALPLGLRFRLFVARLLAATGLNTDRHCEAERRFNEITRNQGNLVASICLSFAGSREEFEDLRQDAFLNIWRGIDSFRAAVNCSMKVCILSRSISCPPEFSDKI